MRSIAQCRADLVSTCRKGREQWTITKWKLVGMTPSTAATAERSVCTNSEILAFQYWDIDAALRFLLLASTDPRP
jgi:hypothetical protein